MRTMDWIRPVCLAGIFALASACGSDSDDSGGDPTPPPVADTEPDEFAFSAASNMSTEMLVTSAPVIISGIDAPADISVSEGAEYAINDGAFTSAAGTIENEDSVRVRIDTSAQPESAVSASLDIGGVSAAFEVTTGPAINVADVDPMPFELADPATVEKGATVTSKPFYVDAINAPARISITGGSYSIDTAEFTADTGVVLPGQGVVIRAEAPADDGAVHVATLKIGAVTESLVLAIPPAEGVLDTIPDFFAFTAENALAAEPGSDVTSDEMIVSGISAAAPITISGGTYSLDGVTFTDQPGEVTDGMGVRVRVESAGAGQGVRVAQVNIGGIPGYFAVVTRDVEFGSDTAPQAFEFEPVETLLTEETVQSGWLLPAEFNAPAPVSVEGGEYRINLGAFTAEPQLVLPGQLVQVRGVSPAAIGETHSVELTIGGVVGTFDITVAEAPVDNLAPIAQALVTNAFHIPYPVTGTGEHTVPVTDAEITLDATLSADPDLDALTFEWTQVSGPESVIEADELVKSVSTATIPGTGTYVFAVTVSDGALSDTFEVTVIVEAGNTAPVADAGPDQTVKAADGVDLDASASTDADSDRLSFSWTAMGTNPGLAIIDDLTSDRPHASFQGFLGGPAPAGDYVFQLTVFDGTEFVTDTVTITVEADEAAAPEAVITVVTRTPAVDSVVELSGANSSGAISYSWVLASQPATSFAFILPGFDPSLASFTPDVAGDYEVELTVTASDFVTTDVTTMVITVN